jgi:FkbM family methyltransferase
MRIRTYLSYLKFHQKLVYLTGLVIEKIGYRFSYHKLRNFRTLLYGLNKAGFSAKKQDEGLRLQQNGVDIGLRRNNSDYDVAAQVLVRDEYKPVISYLKDNNIPVKTIIDAGSNIGLTAVKLLTNFPEAKVICIEPDPSNFKQLEHNLKGFGSRATLLGKALWHKEETLYLDFGFRDGAGWSRRVTEKGESSTTAVPAISLNKLITDFNLGMIDVLKMDIEGSEASLFKEENDLSFLDKTKVIAIEIHDEFDCRGRIYDILKKKNFLVFNSEETTIGVNLSYIKNS